MTDTERYQRLTDALQRFGTITGGVLPPVFEAVTQALETMERMLWEECRRHGAPYGRTDEGFRRWWKETGEALQATEQARTDAAWQRGLAMLRDQGEREA